MSLQLAMDAMAQFRSPVLIEFSFRMPRCNRVLAYPECGAGKVYRQKDPATQVRIVGQAPLKTTVFEMERLRCNACGEIFTAEQPDRVGPDKYDATAVGMIALLKYGTGLPFKRLEKLEGQFGMPLPAATQWELVASVAEPLRPALEEFICQAAQGSVLHNDDTSADFPRPSRCPMPCLETRRSWKGSPPACLLPRAGRRHFVEVAENFPQECRQVLEALGNVYHNDALVRQRRLSPEDRLRFHQETQRGGDEGATPVDESAVGGARDGAELWAGQSHLLSAQILGQADAFPFATGRAA